MEQAINMSNQPTSVQINLDKCLMTPYTVHDPRHVSDLKAQFYDQVAAQKLIDQGDPLVYEIYHHAFITDATDMAMGMSVIHPGKVGCEYHMTKGHLHARNDQAEVYYCVRGQGLLLMDDMADDFQAVDFNCGTAVHIPPQYAHRVVNTGSDILVFVSVFHVAAGHVYAQVTKQGFARLVVEVKGKTTLIDNPKRE